MLVLSCKLGEQIVLPGIETTVAVVAVQGKVARLGISAPARIKIHRAEVSQRIDAAAHSVESADKYGAVNLDELI